MVIAADPGSRVRRVAELRSATIVVISGGPGPEHDVSLASGRAIAAALRDLGRTVVTCTVARDGTWLTGDRPGLGPAVAALSVADVAIPALHGPWGEDGGVQGFLETVGVPYVGSGVLASATCMDKERTKVVLAAAGLTVAPGRVLWAPPGAREAAGLLTAFGLPLFVKPVRGGSSFGVTRVTSAAGLAPAVALAAGYCDAVLVEPELRGREIDVAVRELPDGTRLASPALEILPDPSEPFFSTAAKYRSDRTAFLVPAPVDEALGATLASMACRSFDALGCAGLARVDFVVDEVLGPVVNEVNTFPGFTEHSQFPRMWRAAGVPFPDLVGSLVETAMVRTTGQRTRGQRSTGVRAQVRA